ncbi:MAG: uroporphyrinogen decarboxylase family protein [Sphingomonadaceae bacterium]
MAASGPTMTHRQRVLSALKHEEPDRVPIDFGGTRCSSIHVAGYERLKQHFGLDAPSAISDRMMQPVLVDERILERLDVDTRALVPGAPDRGGDVELDPITYRDEWGVVRSKPPGSYWYDLRESPLAGEISVHDIVRYPWPDPEDPGRVRGLRERALALRQKGDYALVLNLTIGVVHISQYLRGFQDWYVDMAADQGLAGALMDAIVETTTAMARPILREVGDLVDIVFTGDDLGSQGGPQMSPEAYRKVIKPRHARFFRQVREICPDAKIALHTCGSVHSLLPDLIDVGVQVLNPIQVSARDMEPARLKAEFGSHLSFWGGIDSQHVLPYGTTEDVRAEVRRRVAEMGRGGGYMLAAVHNIQPDVPIENVLAMFDEAREAGRYPLDVAS